MSTVKQEESQRESSPDMTGGMEKQNKQQHFYVQRRRSAQNYFYSAFKKVSIIL